MSDLAFNVNGERFALPAEAELWRVRRFKASGRGTPEVVFDRAGLPLTVPVDTDIAAFRRLVDGQPGRYRLDPIDSDHKAVEGGQAAYLQIAEQAYSQASAGTVAPPAGRQDDLIRDLVRVNADMVKQIADRFAMVMESAATLLRAADGAGLPAREPIAAQVQDDDEEDDDEPRNAAGSELSQLLQGVLPLVQMVVAQKLGQTSRPTRNARPAPVADDERDDEHDDAGDDDELESDDDSTPAEDDETPELTPQAMAHFVAIQQRLSPEEAALAQAVAQELSAAEINAWIAQLSSLSVDAGADLIRKTIAHSKGVAS